jgi:hypothetical protein
LVTQQYCFPATSGQVAVAFLVLAQGDSASGAGRSAEQLSGGILRAGACLLNGCIFLVVCLVLGGNSIFIDISLDIADALLN